MAREGWTGALVTLICDSGDRYASTYYDSAWLATNGLDIQPWRDRIEAFLDYGRAA